MCCWVSGARKGLGERECSRVVASRQSDGRIMAFISHGQNGDRGDRCKKTDSKEYKNLKIY